jgi:hypothetical protein
MKVFPTSDNIRKILSHPTGGPFREDGSAEWPDDVYTHRRIADGDVTTEEHQAEKKAEPKKAEAKDDVKVETKAEAKK